MIVIGAPQLIVEERRSVVQVALRHRGESIPLWFAVEPEWARHLTTEQSDSFLLGLLPSIMQMREDVHVEGLVSERLFYHLTHHVMRILHVMFPALTPVKLTADGLNPVPLRQVPGGVVTGFSAGIDSFCVFADYLFGEVPNGYRVTHAITNNVGAHGRLDNARELFEHRYERYRPLMQQWKLPFLKVDSNLHVLVRPGEGRFPQPGLTGTHTFRNTAAVLMLQKLFARYLYASCFPYETCRVRETHNVGHVDPVLDHLLSTESTECLAVGSEYTRVQKTERVAGVPGSFQYLDVCCKKLPRKNCSVCPKCTRTLLTLDLLGRLEDYAPVFDLEKYRRIRQRCLVEAAAADDDDFLREIVQAYRERGQALPAWCRAAGKLGLKRLWPGKRSLK